MFKFFYQLNSARIDFLLLFIVASFGMLITLMLFASLISGLQISTLKKQATKQLDQVESVVKGYYQALDALNAGGYTQCDKAHLLAMRQQMFLHPALQDVGFHIDGKLTCTANMGVLDTPYAPPKADVIAKDTKSEVWTELPLLTFDGKVTGCVVKHDGYDFVLDLSSLNQINQNSMQWELVDRQNDTVAHYAGSRDLFKSLFLKSESSSVTLFDHYVEQCRDAFNFCVGVSKNNLVMLEQHQKIVILGLLISIFMGVLSAYFTGRLLRHHRSVKVRVRDGLRKNSFYSHLQPIVELKTGRIIGFEALARFEDEYGVLYPDQFIPTIRQEGLSWVFTEKLFKKTYEQVQQLNFPIDGFKFSFNIFPEDVVNGKVMELVKDTEQNSSKLTFQFEVVEDAFLDKEKAQEAINFLSAKGILIAIDDFGSGYSNLNQLKSINSHFIKIDKSFVFDMEDDTIRSSLVPHIVNIGKQLNQKLIAEGIENFQQLQLLRSLGVEYGQGYLFSHPVSVEDFQKLLDLNLNLTL